MQTTIKLIFGGTFDPVHNGHIAMLNHAIECIKPDTVSVLPCFQPVHKSASQTSSEDRLAMLALAFEDNPLIQLELSEINSGKARYTVETLAELKKSDETLFFLIGADSLINFTTWNNWQTVLTLCSLVVVTRPNYDLELIDSTIRNYVVNITEINDLKPHQISSRGQIILLPELLNDIASSQLRSQHDTIDNIIQKNVPENVWRYTLEKKLYD
jgi:nicotinate-nucleotide adenylyltransferase